MTATLHRALLIGDVHGQSETLAAILAFAREQNLTDILCTGDLPSKGPGSLARCCALLEEADALVVRGNHDRWRVADANAHIKSFGGEAKLPATALTYLRRLPPLIDAPTPNGPLLLCHGVERHDMAGIYPGGSDIGVETALNAYGIPDTYRYLVCGHTHQRLVRPLFDGTLTVINAGTLLADLEPPAFAILDFDAQQLQWYAIDPDTDDITPAATVSI